MDLIFLTFVVPQTKNQSTRFSLWTRLLLKKYIIQHSPSKMMVGRLLSFWKVSFQNFVKTSGETSPSSFSSKKTLKKKERERERDKRRQPGCWTQSTGQLPTFVLQICYDPFVLPGGWPSLCFGRNPGILPVGTKTETTCNWWRSIARNWNNVEHVESMFL